MRARSLSHRTKIAGFFPHLGSGITTDHNWLGWKFSVGQTPSRALLPTTNPLVGATRPSVNPFFQQNTDACIVGRLFHGSLTDPIGLRRPPRRTDRRLSPLFFPRGEAKCVGGAARRGACPFRPPIDERRTVDNSSSTASMHNEVRAGLSRASVVRR